MIRSWYIRRRVARWTTIPLFSHPHRRARTRTSTCRSSGGYFIVWGVSRIVRGVVTYPSSAIALLLCGGGGCCITLCSYQQSRYRVYGITRPGYWQWKRCCVWYRFPLCPTPFQSRTGARGRSRSISILRGDSKFVVIVVRTRARTGTRARIGGCFWIHVTTVYWRGVYEPVAIVFVVGCATSLLLSLSSL